MGVGRRQHCRVLPEADRVCLALSREAGAPTSVPACCFVRPLPDRDLRSEAQPWQCLRTSVFTSPEMSGGDGWPCGPASVTGPTHSGQLCLPSTCSEHLKTPQLLTYMVQHSNQTSHPPCARTHRAAVLTYSPEHSLHVPIIRHSVFCF